jgi:branched-chain amino acid transport system substrate-binding protein
MQGWFQKNNWEVTGYDKYPTGASDFSTTMIKAKQSGAQVILPIFDMPSSGILVQQWKDMKVPALMAGFISPLMGSKAWSTFGDKIEGVINIVFQAGNIPLKKYPPSTKFYEAYTKRWGEQQSGHMPSESYDSVYALVAAIERARSLDADKIIKEIEKTDMAGSIGRVKFRDHQFVFGDDPKVSAIAVVYQWKKGGKRVPVYPDSVAEDKIAKPSWMK